MADKLLAQRTLTTLDKRGSAFKITAKLYHIEGNKRPHFSCTASGYGRGGCMHEEILELAPEFAQAVNLHLSDDDGTPMHAVENGWYWFGGTKYQQRDDAILASHLRISLDAAKALEFDSKAEFALFVESQRERWQSEAVALRAWLDGSDTVTPEAQEAFDAVKARALKGLRQWE